MLVCPHCQFENPNTNKFCQECGTTLTQNVCFDCGSLVPFEETHCQKCGAATGVVWWAIVQGSERSPSLETSPPAATIGEVTVGEVTVGASAPADLTGSTHVYLDAEQRYRVLEPLSPLDAGFQEQQGRVLDCQPFLLSPLEALLDQQPVGLNAQTQDADANPEALVSAMAIPAIAQPYLALYDQLHQTLPGIHDAWQQDGRQIILLEDRSQLALLLDLWGNEEVVLPPMQILHFLYAMLELWIVLEPWQYQQSLLELDNLRVDEDQILCLQRLYGNLTEHPPSLADLGQVWQSLFDQSQRTQVAAIALLLADLDAGKLVTEGEVRSRIEAIADELQEDIPESTASIDTTMTNPESFQASESPDSKDTSSNSEDLSASLAPTRLDVLQELGAPADLVDVEGDADSDDMPTVVLPMQLFSLDDVGRTDIGRQREHNEDYFGIETQVTKLEGPSGKTIHARNLYILCDGMGGHAGGEVASALAVDTLRRYFKDKWQNTPFVENAAHQLPASEFMVEAVQLANKAIYDVNQQNARFGSGRMGTTLVMMLVQDTEMAVAHVGDSRLYRYTRKRGLEQITIDHEVGQREIQRGVEPEIAYARPDAYQLTQALGPRDENFIRPDVQYFELNEDTLLLLCSDGLTDNDLLETHCQTHVEPLLSSQTNLEQGINKLIDLANQYNGHDNITAIAVRAKVRPNLQHLR
jgi:protein phosphatase